MRIKSYFAPSVQSAIGLARKEFGDDVTLVTSHVAPLDARHLGEYEVVFAIEEPTAVAEVLKDASAEPFEFKQVLEEAVSTVKAPVTVDIPAKLDQIRSLLIEVGIDAPTVKALMTMIQRCSDARPPSACEDFDSAKGADARRQTVKELANSSGGAFHAATVLRELLDDAEHRKPAEPEPPPVTAAVTQQHTVTLAAANPPAAVNSQFTAAELAFFRSVAAPES
jgi:hypothetical protein